MRQLSQAKTWFESTYVVGSAKVVSAPCARVRRRLRLHPGAVALRVRAVVEEPHGAAGGSGQGNGGGGGVSRSARQSSIRWARRQRMLAREPRPESDEDDLFELNVGGKLMQTTRSTLQVVAGSRLAMMFRKGGEEELSYDSKGRVWLDWDPSLFHLVLRYLRETRMMNGGNRRGCLPAVQPADEAPFRRLLSYLGLLPYAGAPIPIAIGPHDPLSDELLLLPPPQQQPVHPHAAMAVGSASSPPPSAAASLGAQNRQTPSQHHQNHQNQNQDEEKRNKWARAEDGNDSSKVEGGPGTAAAAAAAAAAPKPRKRAEAKDGSGAEPGGSASPRGSVMRKSGDPNEALTSGGAVVATGTAADGREVLGAFAGPPGGCQKSNPANSARRRSSNAGNAYQNQQQQPHSHHQHNNSNSQSRSANQQAHHQQQYEQHPLRSSPSSERCIHHHNPPSSTQQNQYSQPLAQERLLESEDFITETATCSILSSGGGSGGSCSSANNIIGSGSGRSSGDGAGCKSGDWQPHERAAFGPNSGSSSPSSPPSARQHDEIATTSPFPTSTSASPLGDGAAAAGSSRQHGSGRQPADASSRFLPSRRVGGGSGAPDRAITKLSPPPIRNVPGVSQLFYISADYNEARGLRVTVHTEDDVRAATAAAASSAQAGQAAEPFDIFIDTTYGEGQISLTFVARREMLPGGVFLGLTSRAQLDRKGAQIPCYGWKSNGCTYNDHTGGGRLGGSGVGGGSGGRGGAGPGPGGRRPPATAVQCSADGGSAKAGSSAVTAISDGASWEVPENGGPYDTAGQGQQPSEQQPLWQKGDSVELIMRQGQQHNQLLLKVNGQAIDVINRLPSFRHWSWYVGLWAGGDISCAVFQRDQYAVYWGDYAVKRYL